MAEDELVKEKMAAAARARDTSAYAEGVSSGGLRELPENVQRLGAAAYRIAAHDYDPGHFPELQLLALSAAAQVWEEPVGAPDGKPRSVEAQIGRAAKVTRDMAGSVGIMPRNLEPAPTTGLQHPLEAEIEQILSTWSDIAFEATQADSEFAPAILLMHKRVQSVLEMMPAVERVNVDHLRHLEEQLWQLRMGSMQWSPRRDEEWFDSPEHYRSYIKQRTETRLRQYAAIVCGAVSVVAFIGLMQLAFMGGGLFFAMLLSMVAVFFGALGVVAASSNDGVKSSDVKEIAGAVKEMLPSLPNLEAPRDE